MNASTEIHPDAVLEALLAKGGRSQRKGNLQKLHDICRKQHGTNSRDFTIPAIGRLCEESGVIKARALYNAASEDYRVLIAAWAAYAGPPAPKAQKPLASHEYLMKIENPALRSIMQAIITERDKLKAQLNTLKAQTLLTVDRRPLGAAVVSHPSAEPVAVLVMAAQLTPSEREALEKAVSPQFLEDENWKEGSHGEIFSSSGRVLFGVGYTKAIRKVLGG